jgi:hypothetical protein
VSILCFNWSNTSLAAPRQQLSEMANGNGDSDGQRRWQLRWPTVTETAMADGKGNGNGNATEMAAAIIRSAKQDDIYGASNIVLPCPSS